MQFRNEKSEVWKLGSEVWSLKLWTLKFEEGSSWSWSYGSWIYNYICDYCLSPLSLGVRIPLRRGVLDTTLCDKGFQWLATDRWFSPGTTVSSTNKIYRCDIAEILLKVALNITSLKSEDTSRFSCLSNENWKKIRLILYNILTFENYKVHMTTIGTITIPKRNRTFQVSFF